MTQPRTEYRVVWEIDVSAASPEEAAEEVWKSFFDHNHDAHIFEVVAPDETLTIVDICSSTPRCL